MHGGTFGKGLSDMMQILALVFFVAAVAVWWHYAARQRKYRAALAARRGTSEKSYHCVEVRAGNPACETARRFGQTRFLSEEAPILPVSGCTVQHCTCAYIHHDDRREDDRRNPYGRWSSTPPAISGERRARTDRRKSEATFRPSIAR